MDGQLHADGGVVVLASDHPGDVDLVLGQLGGYVAQQTHPVDGLDADTDRIEFLLLSPGHRNQACLFVLVKDIGALNFVDAQAVGAGDEADDGIAREGIAALCDARQHTARAED